MKPRIMEIIRYSLDKLKGKWGTALLVSLAITVISIPLLFTSVDTTYTYDIYNYDQYQSMMSSFRLFGLVSFLVLLLQSVIHLGYISYFSRVALGEAPPFSTIFSRAKIWAKALGLVLFMSLFTFLWMLLFFIPGIIAAIRYSMAPYLMAEYPEMGVREAVNRSKELMKGNKGRLFGLELLLNVPTIILGIISAIMGAAAVFGMSSGGSIPMTIIGIVVSIFVAVVSGAAYATFYMNLTGRVLQPGGAGPQDFMQGNNYDNQNSYDNSNNYNNENDPESL